jgi:hypothetical protein
VRLKTFFTKSQEKNEAAAKKLHILRLTNLKQFPNRTLLTEFQVSGLNLEGSGFSFQLET